MTNLEMRDFVQKTINALDAETIAVSMKQLKAKKYGYSNDKAVGLRGPGSLTSDSAVLTSYLKKTEKDTKSPEEKTKEITDKIAETEKKLADLKEKLNAVSTGAIDDSDIKEIIARRAELVKNYEAGLQNGNAAAADQTAAPVIETEDIPQ